MARKIAIIICILMTGMLICIYPGVRETLQETFEGIAADEQTADADTANAHSTDTLAADERTENAHAADAHTPDTFTPDEPATDTLGDRFPDFQNYSPVTVIPENISPGSAAGQVLNSIMPGDEFDKIKLDASGKSLSSDDLSWFGGAAAADFSTGIVYLPCKIVGAEAEGGGMSPKQSRSVWGSLLAGLTPVSGAEKIWYREDPMTEDLAGAMEEGHLFEALLQKADGTVAFSVMVSGLPFLMIDQTDGEDIVDQEDHSGQIAVFPLQTFDVSKIHAGTGDEKAGAGSDAEQADAGAEKTDTSAVETDEENTEKADAGIEKAASGAAGGLESILENIADIMETIERTGTGSAASGTTLSCPCSFHVRGNFAASMDKKPWKVSLKNKNGEQLKESILGMRKDDDWILNPMYSDMSRVREKTAYQLWEKTSAVTETYVPSSRLQYVELLFNGSYHGIYGLTEPLDGKQVGLSDGDLLYKIRQWPWEFDYLSLYSQREGEMEVENGRGGAAVRMTYPREWTEAADWGPMETFQQFCFKTRDLSTLEEAGIGYDRDSVIQLSLFCSLIQAPDNTWKNSILIAKKVTDETDQNGDSATAGLRYVLYRDTWDLNYTFGDHSVKPVEMRQTEFSLDRVASFDTGYDCTYDYSTFRAADSSVKQRTLELWTLWRENGITPEYLCGLADTALEELRASGALSREMQRWPQDQDPADAVENMKEWIRQRFAFLDRHYELTH